MKTAYVSLNDGFVHTYTSWREIAESIYTPLTHRYAPAGEEYGGFGEDAVFIAAPNPTPGWEGMTFCGQMFHLRTPDVKTTFEGDVVDAAPTCLICAGRS